MRRATITLPTIRSLAQDFLRELGICEPPLNADDCLALRELTIADQTLDELLQAEGRALLGIQGRLDAMLDLQERSVWLRSGLHPHKEKLGKIHEVGHDWLPWQSAVLHYCSILDLPVATQREWEREATTFAIECMFLGGLFSEEARECPFSLTTAIELAERYVVSYEAAIRQYVETSQQACCLLVSQPIWPGGSLLRIPNNATEYEIRNYVSSRSFRGHIEPRQRFTSPEISRVFRSGVTTRIVEHELVVTSGSKDIVYQAESFTNSYRVFTLISSAPFDG